MKKLIALCLLWPLALCAQLNTNIVIITGAGNTNDNTHFIWSTVSSEYTNTAGITIIRNGSNTNLWELDGGYFTTNFPYVWYDVGFSSWPPPDPTGMFAGQSTVGSPIWAVALTNYWTMPGDSISFQAQGRNMATTNAMAGLEILLDSNVVYESTLTAGNGSKFSLDGRGQWDGTNLNWFAEMSSGDPSYAQTTLFGTFTNFAVGTNRFQILPIGNTNGFIILSAGVTSSRAPQSSTAPGGNSFTGPGSSSFVPANSGYVAGVLSSTVLPTNAFLGSQEFAQWSTNALSFSGSNYIGEFPQFYSWELEPPILGASGLLPGTNEFEQLNASFNGTNWFAVTNGFVCWTNVFISVTGGNVGVGSLTIWGVDHPELLGKLNGFFGQEVEFGTPVNPNDAATKAYVDSTVHVMAPPVVMSGGWLLDSETTTNGENVTFANHNTVIFWLNSMLSYIPIQSFTIDGTGTNGLLAFTQPSTAYFVEACTNLTQPIFWQTFTNFAAATNTGIVTLTIPLFKSTTSQFFRLRSPTTVTANYSVPILSAGHIWPSNAWSVAVITNTVPNYGYGTFNSNGLALVTVQVTNGILRIVQAIY